MTTRILIVEDEAVTALDLKRATFGAAYEQLHEVVPGLKLLLATYFGDLRDNLATACQLPVNALHFDAVRAPHESGCSWPEGIQCAAGCKG